MTAPKIVFLDTNVFIIGTADPASAEARILEWVGYQSGEAEPVEVVVSQDLFEQILRVTRRLQNKDWGGEILARIWQKLNLRYVLVDADEWAALAGDGIIPREDIGVYLAARNGKADVFISSNRKLVRTLADMTGEFICLTPEAFCEQFLSQ